MDDLEWRPVPGFEGVYAIAEDGTVMRVAPGPRTRPGYIQRPGPHRSGYKLVRLFRAGEGKALYVHRLVALAFLGAPPAEGMYVCHIDGDPANNHYTNLRWGTSTQNQLDRYFHARHGVGVKAPLRQ